MQIMRFVVFFIQEYLYSNILANSIFYSLAPNKINHFYSVPANKNFHVQFTLFSFLFLIPNHIPVVS